MRVDEETVARLIGAASRVRENAWAPYSGFAVGAAVLAADGRVFVGCNVENASYGLSVCAERNAVAAAVAAGARELTTIAIVTGADPPASPCGACRQVLAELGDLTVVIAGTTGARTVTTVAELLPAAFSADTLRRRGTGEA